MFKERRKFLTRKPESPIVGFDKNLGSLICVVGLIPYFTS